MLQLRIKDPDDTDCWLGTIVFYSCVPLYKGSQRSGSHKCRLPDLWWLSQHWDEMTHYVNDVPYFTEAGVSRRIEMSNVNSIGRCLALDGWQDRVTLSRFHIYQREMSFLLFHHWTWALMVLCVRVFSDCSNIWLKCLSLLVKQYIHQMFSVCKRLIQNIFC